MHDSGISFTGEFMVPGESGERIERDHLDRYNFGASFVRDKVVLDIACGYGYAAPILMDAGAKSYLGVDLNLKLIENARREYGGPGVEYKCGDIKTYVDQRLFDVVFCFETIEHVSEYVKGISNLALLLRPGGLLIISSPNRPVTSPGLISLEERPHNPYHTQEFTPSELIDELKKAGFLIDKKSIFGQRNSLLYFKNPLLKRIRDRLLGDPSEVNQSFPRRCFFSTPAYFVAVAKKPE